MLEPGIDFLKDPKDILVSLIHSRDHGNAVGIISPKLGEGVFITAVEDVRVSDTCEIVLKMHDMTGFFLRTNMLKLSEITGVYPFQSEFKNPVLKKAARAREEKY
jgi:hypothetical protein